MRRLMDILDEDEEYRFLLLDGQISPVDDYLEVCPEDRPRLENHIASGRIGVGPWYTLPDLYPIDGECLLRNLNKGIATCESYGGTHLKVAYNSFGWGQTAQFPQIYADYGFETIICAKKVSEDRAPHSEFLWESPDGTRVFTSRLGELARSNFYFHTYVDVRYGLTFLSREFAYSPDKSGTAIHVSDDARADDGWFMTESNPVYDWDRLKECMDKSFDAVSDTLAEDTVLFLSGCDFTGPQPDLLDFMRRVDGLYDDVDFRNARLEEYADALHEALDGTEAGRKLLVVYGELRDGPAGDVSGNALASRAYLKQANKRAQDMLIRKAEPMCAVAEILGGAFPSKGFFNLAWDYMLRSHPHDSINGVTQDKTADDVEDRLAQAIELGETTLDAALEWLTPEVCKAVGAAGSFLCVFNTLPYERSDVIRVSVDTISDETAWSVRITDGDHPVAVQEQGRDKVAPPVNDPDGRPWPLYGDRHDLFVETGAIPGMGCKVLRIEKAEEYLPKHNYWLPMRKNEGRDIGRDARILENEYLKIEMCGDGSFDLTDKASGHVSYSLNRFEDTGDVGNYWAYYPPYRNRTYTTLGGAPRIWMAENGPLCAAIVTEHEMRLPATSEEPSLGFGRAARSENEKTMKIVSVVRLKRGSRHAEVETTVLNNIENHRVRVAFPTGIRAETSAASGHFTVDERPVSPERGEDGRYWPEMQTLPMQTFVDVSDGSRGLALISGDIIEYEATPDEDGTLYLTLFRAVSNMIVTGWECVDRYPRQKGGQLQRAMAFRYGIYPHAGDWTEGRVYREADAFNIVPASRQIMIPKRGGAPGDDASSCAAETSNNRDFRILADTGFMRIEDDRLILSAFKKADDGSGYLLRVFNPTKTSVRTDVAFARPIVSAKRSSMREIPGEDADYVGTRLTVDAPAGKILSFRVEF
jgi:mannosylglycerate hydrolase